MAIRVSSPNGVNIEFPDGTDPGTINRVMSQAAGGSEGAPPPHMDQSYAAGLARTGIGQGTLLGFGDEAMAFLRSLEGEKYDKALADERAKVKSFEYENPKASFAAELAGGAATPGLGLAGDLIRPAATVAGRMIQGAKFGAGLGGVAGFGAGEGGLANRLEGAKSGAEAGTVLGGAVPFVGSTVGNAIQRARDTLAPSLARAVGGIEPAADEVLATRMARAGINPADVAADLAKGQAATQFPNSTATLPETIADTSKAMQKIAGSVYRSGNEAGEIANTFLSERQGGLPEDLFGKAKQTNAPENQYDRLIDTFKRAFAVKSKDFDKQAATIKNEQSTLGDQSYKTAFNNYDNFDQPLADTLTAWNLKARDEPGRPEQAALQSALNLFRRPQDYASMNKVPFPIDTMKRFDAAKRSLDGMIGDTNNANVKRLLVQFKNDALDAVHSYQKDANGNFVLDKEGDKIPTKNVAYQNARDEWGSRAELLNALKWGRDYMAGSNDTSIADFNAMNKSEKTMARLGVTKGLEGMLGGKALGPNADFTQALRKPNVFKRLAAITPQGKTSAQLGELMKREMRMSQSAGKITGGAQTAERQAEDLEFNGRDMLRSAVEKFRSQPGLINLGIDFLSAGAEKAFGFRDDMAKALAERLFNADPLQQQAILARLTARLGKQRTNKFLSFMSKASLATTTSQAESNARALAPQ